MYIKGKSGQSTVEYLILVTAVIAVIIAFVTSSNAPLQKTLNAMYTTTTSDMNTGISSLSASHAPGTPGTSWVSPPYAVGVTP